jgi:hypothetical protein
MSVLRAEIVMPKGVHEEAKSVVNCDERLDSISSASASLVSLEVEF